MPCKATLQTATGDVAVDLPTDKIKMCVDAIIFIGANHGRFEFTDSDGKRLTPSDPIDGDITGVPCKQKAYSCDEREYIRIIVAFSETLTIFSDRGESVTLTATELYDSIIAKCSFEHGLLGYATDFLSNLRYEGMPCVIKTNRLAVPSPDAKTLLADVGFPDTILTSHGRPDQYIHGLMVIPCFIVALFEGMFNGLELGWIPLEFYDSKKWHIDFDMSGSEHIVCGW